MVLGLMLLACGQLGSPEGRDMQCDLWFSRAVEESIMAEPRTTPPRPYVELFGRMADRSWRVREDASQALLAACEAAPERMRWLWWGKRHADPEVRLRCTTILRRLTPCRRCRGTGKSNNWSHSSCFECDGLGVLWPWSMWD